MNEVAIKTARAAELARRHGLGGVLLSTPPAFAWITGGGSNRIDVSRETGAGAVLVTADEQRYLIANNIEMPRLTDEVLMPASQLPATQPATFEPIELAWTAERADARLLAATASRLCSGLPIGCDAPIAGATMMDADVTQLRAPLTSTEIDRYRALGRDAGTVVADALRTATPGLREREVAARVAAALLAVGARPLVLLAGADERLARYRHPVVTDVVWRHTLMLAVCAERGGLVVALSRVIHAGTPSAHLLDTTARTAQVFGALVSGTRPGRTGAELFEIARHTYAAVGVPGEELKHHQGGAIGYRSREWVAHPASQMVVAAPQAFAWNPSITGTKIEDTALITSSGAELITQSPAWPTIEVDGLACAGVLAL